MPEAPALEDFEDALDTEHEWPLIEGEKLRPTHVLRAHPIYFCQSYLDWSNFELETEPPPLAPPIPGEERNDDFDKYLNDQRNEGWELGGHIIECADALATSPDAYRRHCNRWQQEQRRQQDQRVLENYPNPIALRFGRFLAQRDTSKKRGLGACHIAPSNERPRSATQVLSHANGPAEESLMSGRRHRPGILAKSVRQIEGEAVQRS